MQDYYETAYMMIIIVAIFFGLPLGALVFVQTQNFLMNSTTNKRFGKYKRNADSVNEHLIEAASKLRESESEYDDDDFKNTALAKKKLSPKKSPSGMPTLLSAKNSKIMKKN